jgi:hypothetical protein
MTTTNKTAILAALRAFVEKRPGLEFAEYGDRAEYSSAARKITRQRADALELLRYVEMRDSITAADLIPNGDGHLSIEENGAAVRVGYITGQYRPTEYRAAVAWHIQGVLWSYFRSNLGAGCTGDDIRKSARRELGASLARRYFS